MLWWYGGVHWGATTTTTGQNDARRIVWALGEFFFHFLRVFFFVFNDLHRYYRFSKGTVWFNTSNNNDNGPKRRKTRRLGPRWVFFNFFFSFIYYLKMYLGDPGQSETMGPKRRLHCRLGPGIITLPVQVTTPTTTSPHLDGLAMRGWRSSGWATGGARDVSQAQVCFFFVYLIVLTINIISSF